MAKRVSTAELGDKLDTLITLLTAQASQAAIAKEAPAMALADEADDNATLKVDGAYKTHQEAKSQKHANDKGQIVVLYCRVNKANETKLAYALVDRYNDTIVNQPSHRGEVARFTPQS